MASLPAWERCLAGPRTSRSAMRRSSRDLRFSQGGMGVTLARASSGRRSRLRYSTARCCSSTSMYLVRAPHTAQSAQEGSGAQELSMELRLYKNCGAGSQTNVSTDDDQCRPWWTELYYISWEQCMSCTWITCRQMICLGGAAPGASVAGSLSPGVAVKHLLDQAAQRLVSRVRRQELEVRCQQQTLMQEQHYWQYPNTISTPMNMLSDPCDLYQGGSSAQTGHGYLIALVLPQS